MTSWKKRKDQILYDKDYDFIGSLNQIDKRNNLNDKVFYRRSLEFFMKNQNDLRPYTVKINRFIQLVKWSQAFIDDEGNIVNRDFNQIFNIIIDSNASDDIKNKILRLKSDVNILQDIKNRMNKNENQMSIMNWVQYFRNKMYNSISWGSLQSDASIMTCLIGDNIPWSHLSKSALNNMTLAQNSDEFCVIVQYWKFANARLYRENEKIVIDAKTDYLLSYLATEQENAKNRRGDENSDSVTEGVEKDMQLLAKLFFVDEEDIDELCIEKIEVKKWLLFLWNLKVCSTEAFSTILSPFVNLTQINKSNLLSSQGLKTKINNQELKFIINKLSFTEKDVTRKDLFDLPIIAGKYLFTPALLYVHPLYIVYSLLQKQINIGNYFENYLLRKISPRYISWHSINQPKSIKEDHETDILFLDQQNTPAFMECKTFGSPTALKKYITEIDKMYSLRYLINDNASYGHIAFFINYLRTPHTDNLRYRDTSGKLINLNMHFKYIDRAYGLFVSNLFFPISLVKLWRKYKLHFIYYKDLCSSLKTINGINKNEIIFTEKNAPSIFEKIEKNEDNNFFNMSKFRIQKRCRSLEQFNIIIKEYGSL